MSKQNKPVKMMIRIPSELRRRVERGAEESSRSLNREVAHRLREAYSLLDIKQRRMA